MEAKLKVHLLWRVELQGYYSLSTIIPKAIPACGKSVALLTQDIDIVDCKACMNRWSNK